MSGTLTPGQVFTHQLNAVKGWPSPYALDFRATISPTNAVQFNAGMGAYLDESGNFRIGSNPGAVTIFLRQGINDFDVNGDVGNITGSASGLVYSGLVSLGSYEVWTTEFVTDTYIPNDYLTVSNAGGGNTGKVTECNAYEAQVCGIVSRGEFTNQNGVPCLQFWTYHLPPLSIESSADAE
jgi:hypothetical protein